MVNIDVVSPIYFRLGFDPFLRSLKEMSAKGIRVRLLKKEDRLGGQRGGVLITLSPFPQDIQYADDVFQDQVLKGTRPDEIQFVVLIPTPFWPLKAGDASRRWERKPIRFKYKMDEMIRTEILGKKWPENRWETEWKQITDWINFREKCVSSLDSKNAQPNFVPGMMEIKSRALELIRNGTDLETAVDRVITEFIAQKNIVATEKAVSEFRQKLKDEISGWGPLDEMARDPEISEILVNGVKDIFIERNGGLRRANDQFLNADHLRVVIDRIASSAGRRVDVSSPMGDFRLSDGSRANVVLPPLAVDGPYISIRRFLKTFKSVSDLLNSRMITEAQVNRLKEAVQNRENIIVAGNTGSGKTTLLNVMASFIPRSERIVTLEDAAELSLENEHVVRLETRPPNLEGVGEVQMKDLVVNALRMRPDRIIIGECRSSEWVPMIQALNTGHSGSMTTFHANSAWDALQRLESMLLIHAPTWPLSFVRSQIERAIDTVVYLERRNGERRVVDILDLKRAQKKWD